MTTLVTRHNGLCRTPFLKNTATAALQLNDSAAEETVRIQTFVDLPDPIPCTVYHSGCLPTSSAAADAAFKLSLEEKPTSAAKLADPCLLASVNPLRSEVPVDAALETPLSRYYDLSPTGEKWLLWIDLFYLPEISLARRFGHSRCTLSHHLWSVSLALQTISWAWETAWDATSQACRKELRALRNLPWRRGTFICLAWRCDEGNIL